MPGRPALDCTALYRAVNRFRWNLHIASLLDVTSRNTPEGGDPRIGVDLAGGGLRLVTAGTQDEVTYCVQMTSRSGIWVAAAQAHRLVRGMQHTPGVSRGTSEPYGVSPADHFAGELRSGDAVVLEKFVTYASGRGDPPQAELDALRARVSSMAREEFDHYVRLRREALDVQWRIGDIRIVGDEACDRALRFNAFHLLQSRASIHASALRRKD